MGDTKKAATESSDKNAKTSEPKGFPMIVCQNVTLIHGDTYFISYKLNLKSQLIESDGIKTHLFDE